MTITAFDGPVLTRRSSQLTGTFGSGSANQNPQAAPSPFEMGSALLDVRTPYTYYPGGDVSNKVYAFLNKGYQCIDQAPSAIADNNIAASQSPATAALTLVSSSGAGITVGTSITRADTGATVTGLLAIDTAMAGVGFGQDATVNMWDPTKAISRNVRITSGGNDSGITFAVVGYDLYGYPMSEAITGANAGVASGVKAFKYITSITPSGSVATTAKAGTGDVIGLPIRADRIPFVEVWWGNPQSLQTGNAGTVTAAEQAYIIPIPANADLANSQAWAVQVPYAFTVKSALYVTGKPVTTGSKLATLTVGLGSVSTSLTNVGTGGVIALTSAAMTPTGTVIAASAISGTGISGAAATYVGFNVSSVTTFVEGDGYVEIIVQNNELTGGVFTAAVTTSPATTTTGDVRGTIALPSASDGTRRLTVFQTPSVANVSTITGTYGVAQNLATNNG